MLTTTLYTLLKGKQVGIDNYGNRYYEEKFLFIKPKDRQPKRWVMYKGRPDGSKSAPEWQGWLHFTTDHLPIEANRQTYEWEKPHQPNLTGSKRAYSPTFDRKAKPYKAWSPDETTD